MKEPVGLSYLFPACPILNLISIILLLSIIPAFLKTKIFALITYVVLLVLANLISCVNMIIWRNNIRDVPIYADIMIYWWSVFTQLLYVNLVCFTKFVWYMSRPGSTVFLYDNRRRINGIDAMILGVTFLILTPLETFTLWGRYGIMEDVGPWASIYLDLKPFLLGNLPLILASIVSVVFNAMTLRNVIVRRRKGLSGDTGIGSSAHMNKYLLLAISSSVFMLFGNIWGLYPWVKQYIQYMNDRENSPRVFVPISEVMKTIHEKVFWTRIIVDMSPDTTRAIGVFFLTIPVCGMYFFAFFGLGKEARKMHRDNIKRIAHLLGWKWQNKEASGSFDTGNSRQRWRSFAILMRVALSSRNKVLVIPFELPSDSSSRSLDEVVLDTRRHTASKAREAGRNNENRGRRFSMHKPPPPPPQLPDTLIEEGQVQLRAAAASTRRKIPYPLPLPSVRSVGDLVQTGLQSLSRPPQRKPPLPRSSRRENSVDNSRQNRSQPVPLPVPPPAYLPDVSIRHQSRM